MVENQMVEGILKMLAGEDRRSIGKSDLVVAAVLADPTLFASLFLCVVAHGFYIFTIKRYEIWCIKIPHRTINCPFSPQ
jgi:hypothetical protein